MAKLKTAIDSGFWDLNVASPQSLDGWAKAVPGDPFPLDASVASRPFALSNSPSSGVAFPFQSSLPSLPLLPRIWVPYLFNHYFSGSLHLVGNVLGVTGQFRPRKLIADIKNEISSADGIGSLHSQGCCEAYSLTNHLVIWLTSQFSFPPSSFNIRAAFYRGHMSERRNGRKKLMIFTRHLPDHDITLEAAWPHCLLTTKENIGMFLSPISVDLSSLVSDSGLRYHFGIHKNGGNPQAINATDSTLPLSLLPGLCAKAAFTYEKNKYFWRNKEDQEELEDQPNRVAPYDVRLKEPQCSSIWNFRSCASWIWNGKNFSGTDSGEDLAVSTSKRSRFNADLFGSVCYTFQHGKFTKDFGDLTRVDARLDISSATALGKKILNGFKSSTADVSEQPSASPPA
ncbi:hypothetical protein SESBI_30356 [Sesbania bispinosa]|nr:hypothetical protein SESBI_30356 [Sesbania bispinosa]